MCDGIRTVKFGKWLKFSIKLCVCFLRHTVQDPGSPLDLSCRNSDWTAKISTKSAKEPLPLDLAKSTFPGNLYHAIRVWERQTIATSLGRRRRAILEHVGLHCFTNKTSIWSMRRINFCPQKFYAVPIGKIVIARRLQRHPKVNIILYRHKH